jgi:type IV fimbrial biogenesis protein FimT
MRARGFTLIELMIGLSLGVILILLAAPNYAIWTADAQIRNATESIAEGMRFAHAEAIKRNTPVEFILDPTTATGKWDVNVVDTVGIVQTGRFIEAATRAQFAVLPVAATIVTFNGMGAVVANADATPTLTEVRITHFGTVSGTRPLRVLVGGGRTGIKICDPDPGIPASSPRFCTT